MISRILFRLAIAWLVVLGAVYLYSLSIVRLPSESDDDLMNYFLGVLPALLLLILAWVFLPAKRKPPR